MTMFWTGDFQSNNGKLIKAKVRAVNVKGNGTFSLVNEEGATVETTPGPPAKPTGQKHHTSN